MASHNLGEKKKHHSLLQSRKPIRAPEMEDRGKARGLENELSWSRKGSSHEQIMQDGVGIKRSGE